MSNRTSLNFTTGELHDRISDWEAAAAYGPEILNGGHPQTEPCVITISGHVTTFGQARASRTITCRNEALPSLKPEQLSRPQAASTSKPGKRSTEKTGSEFSCTSSDLQFPEYGYLDQIHQESDEYRCRKYRQDHSNGKSLHGKTANSQRRDDQEIPDRRDNNPSARA
jgi:hypothetical protein